MASVRETARQIGWSERRFSQVFREEVGLAPKVWCRVQRFQRAVSSFMRGWIVGGRSWRWIAGTMTSRILRMSFGRFRGWM